MPGEQHSKSAEIASLAEDLVADIELGRLEGDKLIFKALRLARLCGDENTFGWLRRETYGYDPESKDPVAMRYYRVTGRDKHRASGSYANLIAYLEDRECKLKGMRESATVHNTWGRADQAEERRLLENAIASVGAICTRILALLYDFVVTTYHEARFSGLAETIFERYKAHVDSRLAERCADVLKMLPAVYERLGANDPEAVSQGLTTCRRMIDAFADSMYPPRDERVTVDGTTLELGRQHTKNRIVAHIAEHVHIAGRRKRLRQTLSNLYGRVSEAVHREVPPAEAQSLVLQTYLFLGEVLTLEAHSPEERTEPVTPDLAMNSEHETS